MATNWHKRDLQSRLHADDIENSRKRSKADKAERDKAKESPEFIWDVIRRSLLQKLDKANKKNPENRVENTLTFLKDLFLLICKDYSEFMRNTPITEEKLKAFVYHYSAHIYILKKFDKEMNYEKSLVAEFNSFLYDYTPFVAKHFNLNEIIINPGD